MIASILLLIDATTLSIPATIEGSNTLSVGYESRQEIQEFNQSEMNPYVLRKSYLQMQLLKLLSDFKCPSLYTIDHRVTQEPIQVF